MIAYASRPTGHNADVLRAYGWRVMLSPDAPWMPSGFPGYALDNGAWTAHTHEREWDADSFTSLLERYGDCADWVVVPDVVADRDKSLERTLEWLPVVMSASPMAMVAVQDGMVASDVAVLLNKQVGLFIGGTTEWKLETMFDWCVLAHERDALAHVGRVNTVKRINMCLSAGADSFDGSGASRWSRNAHRLDAARRQKTFWEIGL